MPPAKKKAATKKKVARKRAPKPVLDPSALRVARALDMLGRSLITIGLLMLGFVAYQLWGTNITEARQQRALENQYKQPDFTVTVPKLGEGVGRIRIPAMKLDKMIVAGVSWKALKKGPGLFPNSPLPGQFGNVAIAGHRTTFGAPFEDIDKMAKGDTIEIDTPRGTFTYTVTGPPRIVPPSAVEVVETLDKRRALLTLVSCHPKWTAARRIIVVAEMTPTEQTQPATPFMFVDNPTETLEAGWFHDPKAWPAVAGYAVLMALIAAAAINLGKTTYRRSIVYPVMAGPFLLVLYLFYENLARLLPTNI